MMRPVHIKPVMNGFLCQVGCQEVVFTSKKALLNALGSYIDNPGSVEREFIKNAVNKPVFLTGAAEPLPPGALPEPVSIATEPQPATRPRRR